jgi:hypothetical protein
MMKAVSTSETSVCFYKTTRRNIPEDGDVQNAVSIFYMHNKDSSI